MILLLLDKRISTVMFLERRVCLLFVNSNNYSFAVTSTQETSWMKEYFLYQTLKNEINISCHLLSVVMCCTGMLD